MITQLKTWYQERKTAQSLQALSAGYGWAWTAFRIEGHSLQYIAEKSFCEYDNTPRGRCFDRGVDAAVTDIETFLKRAT